MSIAEDLGKLVDLGNDLMAGKKTLEGLVDEAAENAGLAPKGETIATPAPPAKVLSLVSRNPVACTDLAKEQSDESPSLPSE